MTTMRMCGSNKMPPQPINHWYWRRERFLDMSFLCMITLGARHSRKTGRLMIFLWQIKDSFWEYSSHDFFDPFRSGTSSLQETEFLHDLNRYQG